MAGYYSFFSAQRYHERMRFLLGLLLLLLVAAGGAYIYAGHQPAPAITIAQPVKFVGQSTPVDITVVAPQNRLTRLQVTFEQNGKQTPLFTLPAAGAPAGGHVAATISRATVPDLKSGPARILVTAERPVLHGLRKVSSTATRDVQVRLERPTIAVVSTKHYINLGGSEVIVYRATPADIESGMQVGDLTYPGYPASGAKIEGVHITDPNLKVAFFALRWDQDVNTPMFAYARDEAGNSARAEFDKLTFPKPFKKSRIQLDDKFINRVVPADSRHHPGSQSPGGCAGGISRAQRRVAQAERRDDRRIGQEELTRHPLGRRRLPSLHQQCGRGRVRRSANLHLQRQGGGQADPPRLRPRPRRQFADRRRQHRNGRLRRAARDLRQLRDHRSRDGRAVALRPSLVRSASSRAMRSRRSSRSASAARPGWPAATTSISRCSSTARWSTRWSGGTRTGSRTESSASSRRRAPPGRGECDISKELCCELLSR